MKAGVPSTYLICICVGTLYHAIFRVVAIATPMKTFFFVASPFLRHICSVISGYSAPSPNTIVCHSEPANDANLCHSDASYKYKNCACAGVLSLFLQSYGRVRIHTGRLEQVVCWLQLLPYEAERRTAHAQRCQAARLRARYRPVTPRRPSSSSELLLHGSWRVRTCTCDCFVLRGQETGECMRSACKGRDVNN